MLYSLKLEPYNIMQIRKHTSQNEAFFSFMDENPASRQFFITDLESLQNSLAFCGLDSKRYQSHSFRIGAATAAAIGRWK